MAGTSHRALSCLGRDRLSQESKEDDVSRTREASEDPLILACRSLRGIDPSPYLGRYHWIRVERATSLSEERLMELIRESHSLVAAKLSRRLRVELGIVET